jgi:hypothetical protein
MTLNESPQVMAMVLSETQEHASGNKVGHSSMVRPSTRVIACEGDPATVG